MRYLSFQEDNEDNREKKQYQDETIKVINDLADLVIKAGCDPNTEDDDYNTATLDLLYRVS